jgi:hypothetical protein
MIRTLAPKVWTKIYGEYIAFKEGIYALFLTHMSGCGIIGRKEKTGLIRLAMEGYCEYGK